MPATRELRDANDLSFTIELGDIVECIWTDRPDCYYPGDRLRFQEYDLPNGGRRNTLRFVDPNHPRQGRYSGRSARWRLVGREQQQLEMELDGDRIIKGFAKWIRKVEENE